MAFPKNLSLQHEVHWNRCIFGVKWPLPAETTVEKLNTVQHKGKWRLSIQLELQSKAITQADFDWGHWAQYLYSFERVMTSDTAN